jgi:hypothetical protein
MEGGAVKILAIVSGEYGDRHVANIRAHGPADWTLTTWVPPKALPMVIDEPEEFLPRSLAPADLVLAFQEDARAAQLIADIARLCKAKAVIAPVDREEWMPRGLVQQVGTWLAKAGIAAAFPKPLCALTESTAAPHNGDRPPSLEIAEFARVFGRPSFEITCDPQTRTIASVRVVRDAVCGCARHVAEKLVGMPADDAEQAAGLAHHHYPCMASMGIDPDFNDTLMHVSGNILKQEIGRALGSWKRVTWVEPDGKVGNS